MRGIHGQVMKGVRAALRELFRDKKLIVSATWKAFSKSEFDKTQRKNIEVYVEYPVSLLNFQKTESSGNYKNMTSGLGSMITGGLEFAIRTKDAPATTSLRDMIVTENKIYEILKIHHVLDEFMILDLQGLK